MSKTTNDSHPGEPKYSQHGKNSGHGGGMEAPMSHTAKEDKGGMPYKEASTKE